MNFFNGNDDLELFLPFYGSTIVYKTSSSYQNIYVTERGEYEGMRGKFRMLQSSSNASQGIMNLEQQNNLVVSYIRITVDLINHYLPDFKKGFIIGHGIGTVSSFYSEKYMVTAEIDPVVVEVSKKYFGHSGHNVEIGDGQVLLKKQEAHSQDIIFLDAFNSDDVPTHLTTEEFFTLTDEKLSDTGILIMNYIGKLKHDKFLHTLYSTISKIYPCVKVFAPNPKKISKQNILFVASRNILEDYTPREAEPIQISGN
ncbi:spermidine synthase [Neobacillus citreus]|uniref:Fused MFS/spermidine synthase n=1 Tax=Neobacillus citreus TaxID=2833578 RepID=A0A942YBD0_9BACI|nr:fused MFS/spermidine synthase [Neobacillus citreus]MCH6264308.1 fused MFS/spermidine synthase [Neobacillus citreus]